MCGDNQEDFNVNDTIVNFCGTPGKDYTYYLVLKKVNSMGVIFHATSEPFPIDRAASALKVLPFRCSWQSTRPSSIWPFNSRVQHKSRSRSRQAGSRCPTTGTFTTTTSSHQLEPSTTWCLLCSCFCSCRARSSGRRSTSSGKVVVELSRTEYLWGQAFSLLGELVHYRPVVLPHRLYQLLPGRTVLRLRVLHGHTCLHPHLLSLLPLLHGHGDDGLHDRSHGPEHQSRQRQQLRDRAAGHCCAILHGRQQHPIPAVHHRRQPSGGLAPRLPAVLPSIQLH